MHFQKIRPETILPLVTLLLFIGLIISLLVPKKVIDTYKVNVTEEEGDTEVMIDLPAESELVHTMNTGSRPMLGIQIAISKNGSTYTNSVLSCEVYQTGTENLLSKNEYSLAQGEELQYIYIPFADYEKCMGTISIRFQYIDRDGNIGAPAILANGSSITGSGTIVNGAKYPGNIKCMYVYTHDTYPLVYDLRILFLMFLAATMTASIPGYFHKKGEQKK